MSLPILTLEWLRLRRARRPAIAVLVLALYVGLVLVGFATYAATESGGEAEFRAGFENESYFNGLTFALYCFHFGLGLLLPVFAIAEGGAQFAADRASGAERLYLTRPIARGRLFGAKALLGALHVVGLVAALLALGLGVGTSVVGLGDLELYPGVLQMTDRPQRLEQTTALWRFALAWPVASLAVLTAGALGALVASWSSRAVSAVSTGVALYLVLLIVGEVHLFRDLRPFLFTADVSLWRELFQESIDLRTVLLGAARLIGWSALFVALALYRFRTREER
ncbi:MAG: ABC transporter permease subunit [Planctomycetota bacterium]